MFSVAKFTALTLAVSSASALVVPRATPPAGWSAEYLEDYDTYHARYLALDCHSKHDTKFFDQCCHPLLAVESLSSHRPTHCNPLSASSPNSMPSTSYEEEEDCDYEDVEDQELDVRATEPSASSIVFSPSTNVASTTESAPESSSNNERASAATVYTGGYATYFYQNGNAGACGKVHSDSDLIAALDADRYGNLGAVSSHCNQQVKITNANNGKSVTVTVADACPGCKNSNSIDLSEGAFRKIAPLSDGIVPITWSYL